MGLSDEREERERVGSSLYLRFSTRASAEDNARRYRQDAQCQVYTEQDSSILPPRPSTRAAEDVDAEEEEKTRRGVELPRSCGVEGGYYTVTQEGNTSASPPPHTASPLPSATRRLRDFHRDRMLPLLDTRIRTNYSITLVHIVFRIYKKILLHIFYLIFSLLITQMIQLK